MSTTTELELVVFEQEHISPNSTAQTDKSSEDVTFAFVQANANIITATPDGGYGWAIVASYAVGTFWHSGTATSWGILQAALPDSTLRDIPTATVSWVGSLGLGCIAFGLFAIPLMKWLGSKTRSLLGVVLMGAGLLASGFSTSNLAGLFVCNALPVQYFSKKLGLANGLVKLGGGIGGTVLAVALDALITRVGIDWAFRILGKMTLATGIPPAWFLKDRTPIRSSRLVELSRFRSVPFTAVFLAGAIGTFAMFVPSYFLPLLAKSIGLSSTTGAALVSGFNLCTALGRFLAGPLCDKIGPINMLLMSMIVNSGSMLAIWPVSDSLGPLLVFAMLNGFANGSFYTALPTVVGGMFGPARATVAMSMAVTGWTGGYLMGAPIAGYLLQAGGGRKGGGKQGINVYRPAIFYAGGVALVSCLFVLAARLKTERKMVKRV